MAKNFYYKDGISLNKYCKEHGLNYNNIRKKITNKTSQKEIEEIINSYIKVSPKSSKPSYKIDGLSLRQYALVHNYIYPTLRTYAQEIRKKYPDKSDNEIALLAVKHYEENHAFKELWFYKGERLVDYCKRNNLTYKTIFSYLYCMDIKDRNNIPDWAIKLAIKKYNIKIRKDCFKKLKLCQKEEEFKKITNLLNIDWDSVKLVMSFNFDCLKAIYFVWYFGKEKDSLIKLDKKRIKNVYNCLKKVDLLEINFLLGYYYTGIYDTRQLIYNKLFLSVRKIVINLINTYEIKYNYDYHEELKAEADMLIFDFINRTNSRYLGQIISYMNAYIKGRLKAKIIRDLPNHKQYSLNKIAYQDSNKEIIDTLVVKPIIDISYFSIDMINIIKSLDIIEQKYIILRFKKLFEDEEIASLLDISLVQVLEIREKALEKLRQDKNIKLFKKLY